MCVLHFVLCVSIQGKGYCQTAGDLWRDFLFLFKGELFHHPKFEKWKKIAVKVSQMIVIILCTTSRRITDILN